MKIKKLIIAVLGLSLLLSLIDVNLSAQDYSMNKTLCAHYVKLSREQVVANNLPLAKLYAQKAIQANPWEKSAWADYNDIIQRLANNGNIEDFNTFIQNSAPTQKPTEESGTQFEGC